MVADSARDADTAGLSQRFEPRRNIHPVAENIVLLDDHVSEIDADAEVDAPLSGNAGSRSAIPRCTSTAQRTASTTLANSAKKPSPVFLTTRPRCSAIFGSTPRRDAP